MKTKKCQLTNDQIELKIKEAGVQPTLQRIALCQYLLCQADHPTAEQIFEWAQANLHKISQATVYNTLGTLTDAGLLKAIKFPHTDKVIYDCNTQDHFHFYDESTGQLVDVDHEAVQLNLDLPKKFKVSSFDLVLRGEIKS